MRMRTIDQAAEHLKAADPETALTKTALRRLVTTGALPSVKVGKKYLVSLEALDTYLCGDQETVMDKTVGGIRPVAG